ncbi:CGNR zinc finger domain-containing protein [Streptosporangium sandarakinum]|uniref:Putative RNA-binding Zn ribbon-like protein n=1 Tax=Streptosporangium sandarakinum TaxID=1260955 RepID=A0A852UW52_9ACTN|nr:CGNR zinc finger domain-containing protein [Streptosporangium sandarakinum]NYF41582.1 putative RNA-binding Zn ribbon-like protein [Streptosporangium sandarakinum]
MGSIQAHTFRPRDLVGGHIIIDLVNTVTARDTEPIDWLDGYPRLLEWAALTSQFDPVALTVLQRLADTEPDNAALALDRTRELREALHDLITTLIRKDAPASPQAVDQVEKHWKHAVASARLTVRGNTPQPQVNVETSGLEYLNHELALQAFDLLRSLPLERTHVCPGLRCGWLFIDRSRGGRRRWCDMATCGNAAKGRTHYQRKRQTASNRATITRPTTSSSTHPVAEPSA